MSLGLRDARRAERRRKVPPKPAAPPAPPPFPPALPLSVSVGLRPVWDWLAADELPLAPPPPPPLKPGKPFRPTMMFTVLVPLKVNTPSARAPNPQAAALLKPPDQPAATTR
jgi:hypothetical protein